MMPPRPAASWLAELLTRAAVPQLHNAVTKISELWVTTSTFTVSSQPPKLWRKGSRTKCFRAGPPGTSRTHVPLQAGLEEGQALLSQAASTQLPDSWYEEVNSCNLQRNKNNVSHALQSTAGVQLTPDGCLLKSYFNYPVESRTLR